MSLHIQKASEAFTTHLKVLLYGSAGTGKTSLAGTAKDAVIFNFANSGSHRAIGSKPVIRIKHWWQTEDIFTPELLSALDAYRTLVLDDAGTIQNLITQDIITAGNYLYTANGTLTQAGWGQLKTHFVNFMTRLDDLQKDIILISHDIEEVIGDKSNKYIMRKPDILGSAYKHFVRDFDLIGHLSTTNKRRVVEFAPSNVLVAKTFLTGVTSLEVPIFDPAHPQAFEHTLARLITTAKEQINAKSEGAKIVENYKEFIDSFSNPADFDTFGEQLKKDESVKNGLQTIIRTYAKSRMEALGIIYDKEAKSFKFKEGYTGKEPKPEEGGQEKEMKSEESKEGGKKRMKKAG